MHTGSRSSTVAWSIVWLVIYTATAACTCQGTTFAPPLLAASSGVPAAHRPGGGEVRLAGGLGVGSGGCFGPALTGHGMGRVAVAATRWLELEGTLWSASVPNQGAEGSKDGRGWGILVGSAGLRLWPDHRGLRWLSFLASVGLGCGGARGGPDYLAGGCGSQATGSLAGGGTLGVDLGFSWGRFGLSFNNRWQLTGARSLPMTVWGLHSLGIQYGRVVIVGLELGPAYLANAEDHLIGGVASASLAVRWGLEE